MENSQKAITIEQVSLTVAILFMSIYLFGGFPIIYLFVKFLALVNFPIDLIKVNSYYVTSTFQIVMVIVLNYFMLKRYRNYLLSYNWKMCFGKYLIVGLKWSIPVIILNSIFISIPSLRNGIISNYVTMRTSPLRDLSETIFILFSVRILICAIFEEFLFRGIIQQKLEKFLIQV